MRRAIDIASYILSEKGRLSGYQLQKLLYYSQAWCLVTQNRPVFTEQVRAWEHGPIVYEVAHAHRGRLPLSHQISTAILRRSLLRTRPLLMLCSSPILS